MMGATEAPSLARAAAGGAAAPRRQHHIPELLEIHADELAYLWGQRRAALFDTRYTLASFLALNERIEAHLAGLLTVPSALPALLGKRLLAATDRDEVFAAACALLRLGNASLTARIVEMFATASGPLLLGLRDALGASSLDDAAPSVQAKRALGEPARAVAAATVLAQRGLLRAEDPQLKRLLLDADDAVAAQAWRVLLLVDAPLAVQPGGPPPRPYKPALLRKDPPLRQAVLACAAWTAQPWLMRGLRLLVSEGDTVALGWLAALGGPEHDTAVQAAMAQLLPAVAQTELLGRCGRPWVLTLLLKWMHGSDPKLAAAACDAYMRLTGEDVRGKRVTPKPADDADEFEREMAPSVWLPDPAKVELHHDEHGTTLAAGGRWNRGLDIGGAPPAEALQRVDLPARWDACARAAFARRPVAPPPPAL